MPPRTPKPIDQCSPSAPGSDLARVRDNQRRSRARRKEYLQELESKLRKSEALGVQASIDIQLAARGVSEENARLREENGKLKEDNEKLKQMLRESQGEAIAMADDGIRASFRKNVHTHSAYGTNLADIKEGQEGQAFDASASSSVGMNHYPRNTVASSNRPSSTSTQLHYVSASSGTLPDESNANTRKQDVTQNAGPSYTYIPTQPGRLDQSSYTKPNRDLPFGDDTSSCEYAAHIITSMRADVSTDDVRADLGCGSDVKELRKCMVDNSKLFTAVDRYTR